MVFHSLLGVERTTERTKERTKLGLLSHYVIFNKTYTKCPAGKRSRISGAKPYCIDHLAIDSREMILSNKILYPILDSWDATFRHYFVR